MGHPVGCLASSSETAYQLKGKFCLFLEESLEVTGEFRFFLDPGTRLVPFSVFTFSFTPFFFSFLCSCGFPFSPSPLWQHVTGL